MEIVFDFKVTKKIDTNNLDNNMKEKFENEVVRLFAKNYQMILTLLYLFAIATGMLFNAVMYGRYGINIFDYSDIFDFLIAPFADYRILLFTIISFFLTYVFVKFDLTIKTKYPKFYFILNFGIHSESWSFLYRCICATVAFVGYMYISAIIYGNISERQVNTQYINVRFVDNEKLSGNFIGKTKDIIFIRENGKVKVIPINSLVKEYEIK